PYRRPRGRRHGARARYEANNAAAQRLLALNCRLKIAVVGFGLFGASFQRFTAAMMQGSMAPIPSVVHDTVARVTLPRALKCTTSLVTPPRPGSLSRARS